MICFKMEYINRDWVNAVTIGTKYYMAFYHGWEIRFQLWLFAIIMLSCYICNGTSKHFLMAIMDCTTGGL